MEKIKEALDKARKERLASTGPQDVKNSNKSEVETPSSFNYSMTSEFNVDENMLNENRVINIAGRDAYSDAYTMLSKQILHRMEDNNWSTIGVTSARDNAGKTLTAINLGISIAKEHDYTVLLVDSNLRDPDVCNKFGIKAKIGLTDYLRHGVQLPELLIKPKQIEKLVILPAGAPSLDSAEMLSSPKMTNLVNELKQKYPNRIIIFDLPSTLVTADAVGFTPEIDCVLLVVEDDVTTEKDIHVCMDKLSYSNIIGTVLNKAIM